MPYKLRLPDGLTLEVDSPEELKQGHVGGHAIHDVFAGGLRAVRPGGEPTPADRISQGPLSLDDARPSDTTGDNPVTAIVSATSSDDR